MQIKHQNDKTWTIDCKTLGYSRCSKCPPLARTRHSSIASSMIVCCTSVKQSIRLRLSSSSGAMKSGVSRWSNRVHGALATAWAVYLRSSCRARVSRIVQFDAVSCWTRHLLTHFRPRSRWIICPTQLTHHNTTTLHYAVLGYGWHAIFPATTSPNKQRS